MDAFILIPGREEQLTNYGKAIRRLGGRPFFSPEGGGWEACGGLLLPGGGDLDPALYGQPPLGSHPPDRERDRRELRLAELFLAAGRPVLGICRGLQVLNVLFGGTLVQDLPGHSQLQGRDRRHPVRTAADTQARRLCGGALSVNSAHHQAADRPGAGLSASAWAEDGVIEALEHPTLPVLAVQWHPERLPDGAPGGGDILAWLLDACGRGG